MNECHVCHVRHVMYVTAEMEKIQNDSNCFVFQSEQWQSFHFNQNLAILGNYNDLLF